MPTYNKKILVKMSFINYYTLCSLFNSLNDNTKAEFSFFSLEKLSKIQSRFRNACWPQFNTYELCFLGFLITFLPGRSRNIYLFIGKETTMLLLKETTGLWKFTNFGGWRLHYEAAQKDELRKLS
jgi:hypothetical protein